MTRAIALIQHGPQYYALGEDAPILADALGLRVYKANARINDNWSRVGAENLEVAIDVLRSGGVTCSIVEEGDDAGDWE